MTASTASETTVETTLGTFTVRQDQTAGGKPAPRWRVTDPNGDESVEVFTTKKAAVAAVESHVETVLAEQGKAGDTPAEVETPEVEPVADETPKDEPAKERTPRQKLTPEGDLVGFYFKGDKKKPFVVDANGRVWLQTKDGFTLRRQTDRGQLVGWIESGERGYSAREVK